MTSVVMKKCGLNVGPKIAVVLKVAFRSLSLVSECFNVWEVACLLN